MFIEKRSNGTYRFGEWYIDPLTGKRHRASVTYTKNTRTTRKQAQEELKEKIEKLLNSPSQKSITITEAFNGFIHAYKDRYAQGTLRKFRNTKRQMAERFGPEAQLANITKAMIISWAESLLYQQNLANGTVQNTLAVISSVYTWAGKTGYLKIGYNPCKNLPISWKNDRSKADSIEEKLLTDEELELIWQYCKDIHRPDFLDYFKTLYLTGMRQGEASGLQVKDYIQRDGVWGLTVDGTLIKLTTHEMQETGHRYEKGHPKTQSSNRFVSLSDEAREIIERNIEGKKPDDWIFWTILSDTPRPIDRDAVGNFFKMMKKRKIGSRRFHSHQFRHTHVSKLAELGVPLYQIQHRLGHSSGKTTQEIYLHVTNNMEKNLIDKLNKL